MRVDTDGTDGENKVLNGTEQKTVKYLGGHMVRLLRNQFSQYEEDRASGLQSIVELEIGLVFN